ncbi:hypothetical protein PSJE_29560 [Pseudomonas jessenii]|uniref:Uncharacterized protein n=1 Tax=Pseudomonas jessenii TaxID=77298 RepID=A0A231FX61_PSEJE|nr:hypothetical protein [Pseudomonas jessenii]OXR28891.1 hypothetical protein PSJE_29560 [Pseudomonas jessenii]SEB31608.1 hypothetical protein SAMN04490187_0235 [Pseudomonas jessenii]
MKNGHPLCWQSGRTRGRIVSPIKRLFLCGSVSSLLITTAQFALYWLVLGAMMTNTDCRIEDDENFIFDEVLSLFDGYACSSISSESVVFGNFLTPQEA